VPNTFVLAPSWKKERYFGLEVFKEAEELGLGNPKLLEDSSA
jgi:hypothetical protein